MVENIRAHERIKDKPVSGTSIALTTILPKPVEVYIPDIGKNTDLTTLLIHLHGGAFIPRHAVIHSEKPVILAAVNLGFGSSVYERAFLSEGVFGALIDSISHLVSEKGFRHREFTNIHLTSFSAGYGAVRALLKNHMDVIDGLILLDGLHTSYVPDRKVLHEGGVLNTEILEVFLEFARQAAEGRKRLLITHSEIFPGTYASTTETADYIIKSLGLKRMPVVKWGPVGMQLVSETSVNGLTILGFAGNTAPDHVDHLHGLPVFLEKILGE
ncbi:hypothetical protein ACFL60_03935 [Candidatus Omnitrophota bacterium]